MERLLKYDHCPPTKYINYVKIPVTIIDTTDAGVEEFNDIIGIVEGLGLSKIERTPSGGINNSGYNCYKARYDLRELNSMIELTLITKDGCWRFQFRNSLGRMGEVGISGKQAFWKFNDVCRKHGVDLESYRIRDFNVALEHKKGIEPYMRHVVSNVFVGKDLPNVHHIDINSSFMSNLAKEFTEFLPVAQELYNGRKQNPVYKGVMTNAIGYFQSEYIKYAWAHLSKASVNGNNEQVRDLVKRLKDAGRVPLLINTDGVWYSGDIYTDENEGVELGKWKTDHKNCTLLIKSPNAYQYKEDGIVHTVMSGRTKLDKAKPREQWNWGDIFNTDAVEIAYILKNGRIRRI